MTKSSALILEILHAERRHLSAIQLWESAKARGEALSLATVYNSLKNLVHKKEVIELRLLEGGALYDARLDHHAHLLCTVCGEVTDADIEPQIQAIQREAERVSNYRFHTTEVTLKGTCVQCQHTGEIHSKYNSN